MTRTDTPSRAALADDDLTTNPWTVKRAEIVYDNPWITVTHNDVLTPKGAPGVYGTVSFKKLALGVLPLFADGTAPLVGQYRFPLGRYSWELPEGGHEDGSTPLESAQRELREETGLRAGRWVEILDMHLSNSITNERAVCFLALDLTQGEAAPEDVEVLQLARRPFSEILADVLAGRITDAMTVAMILRGHHMAVTGALPERLSAAMLGETP